VKITWRGAPTDAEFEASPPKVGDAFYDDDYLHDIISAAHVGKRAIIVILPGNVYFCIYSKQITDGVQHEPGWTVSGEPEALTLQPSVNVKGAWHGFISSGAFSPDVAENPAPAAPHVVHGGLSIPA
jgi:uncharacterized protein DUF6527